MNFNRIDYQREVNPDELENQIRLYDPLSETPARSPPPKPLSHPSSSQFMRSRRASNESNYPTYTEESSLLGRFPYSLVMKVSSSEPRDVLQSERTCLTFIRFATSLFFAALGIVLNFRLHTDNSDEERPGGDNEPHDGESKLSVYSEAVSFLLIVLAFLTLIISGIDYFVTIERYAKHKIQTYNYNNLATVLCITCVIITLLGINVSLIIESYIKDR